MPSKVSSLTDILLSCILCLNEANIQVGGGIHLHVISLRDFDESPDTACLLQERELRKILRERHVVFLQPNINIRHIKVSLRAISFFFVKRVFSSWVWCRWTLVQEPCHLSFLVKWNLAVILLFYSTETFQCILGFLVSVRNVYVDCKSSCKVLHSWRFFPDWNEDPSEIHKKLLRFATVIDYRWWCSVMCRNTDARR